MVDYAQIPYSVNDSKAHDEMALKMAEKSMTLLKNDGILPLNKKKIKRIAVVGPNAKSSLPLYANYHGTASNPITVLQGIQQELGDNTEVTYFKGCPLVINELSSADYSIVEPQFLFHFNENKEKELGIKGEYFKGIELDEKPLFTRNDKNINFLFGDESPTKTELAQGIINPEQAIGKDHFSIRWTGQLMSPVDGKGKIGIHSDDGFRLWIDNELIAEDWTDHAMQISLVDFHFEKEKVYDIKVEYYESEGGAGVQLIWNLPNENAKAPDDPMTLSQEELEEIKNNDIVIFVGGLDATWEGEEMGGREHIEGFNRGDRTTIELPLVQQQALKDIMATGTPVVFVMMAGSAVALDGLENEIPAILASWYPGQRGGNAVANVLFGKHNPAGRLPVTFYKSTDQLSDFKNYNMRAGNGFTYRYFQGETLYPFGHGLSYTQFKYSDLKVNKSTLNEDDTVALSFKVKNTGKLDGEEVVQLYVKDVASEIWMPTKQLRNFQRIALEQGEEKTISMTLNPSKDLRYYDSMKRSYAVESGAFEIQVGASSEDIRLTSTITIR